jgi:hypothetical protein
MMKAAGIFLLLANLPVSLAAQDSRPAPARVAIHRAAGRITVDGDLSDPGWKDAAEITQFYEVQPGDSVPPKVRTLASLTYDDRFFYVAIRCDDPEPAKIRAHYSERDHALSDQDLAAILLDTRNDGRTALELYVNPYGIQDDFVRDESTASGTREDSAPDFYWDAAAKITAGGWQVEMRIPFSTLRYSSQEPQTWGIVVFRNYPRDFRYQIASNPAPRDSLCFVCHATRIEGLTGLPHGAHLVVAPYATLTEQGVPRGGAGGPYVNRPARGNGGLDAKFLPNENMAIDATLNPDFSQVESDVAQITADARFALFYPEKRPFFMEQSQLFNTPIQAVYTRTITSARWGARATGQFDSNAYTLLTGEDRGGGTVILPGSAASTTAPQDFRSVFGIGRTQHAFANRSYVSLLATDREIEGGGYNRVLGPDFQWTPGDHDQVVGQFLISSTRAPNRPDLSSAWTGQSLGSHALSATWNHSSYHWSWSATYRDLGESFRADDGFVPQVGIREGLVNANYVFYTAGFFSRVTPGAALDLVSDANGRAVTRLIEPGIAFQGKSNLFAEIDYNAHEQERAGPNLLHNERWHVVFSVNPPGALTSVSLDGHVGKSIDFVGNRSGRGGDLTFSATARPTRHLQLDANLAGQWLNLAGRRLFTAKIERLKATYVFSRTTFARVIGQYLRTDSHPELYPVPIPRTAGGFQGSALFGYQVDWQTVLYAGYGDTRVLSDNAQLLKAGRQLFLKLSYAFQR